MGTLIDGFGWSAGLVKSMCNADPAFAGHVLGLDLSGRHFLALVCSGLDDRAVSRTELKTMAKRIRSEPRKAVLTAALGDCPPGLCKVVGKLGGRLMSREDYTNLVGFLREKNAAKVLVHSNRLTSFVIQVLGLLDPPFRRLPIINAIRDREDLNIVRYGIESVRRLRPTLNDQQIAVSLARSISRRRRLGSWLNHHLEKVDLPKPPWPGTACLQPLAKTSEVLAVADSFGNCMAGSLTDLVFEKRAFFIWKGGGGRAVAALDKAPILGWVVSEINGPCNRPVPRKLRQAILAEFEAAGYMEIEKPACLMEELGCF